MNGTQSTNVAARALGIAAALLALLPGCAPPSFLITPVSTRRALEETTVMRDGILTRDKIALIDVSGGITSTTGSSLLGGRKDNPVSLLLEQLDLAQSDDNVKAVVLRINSPGGGVVASELMHDELSWFREKTGKPVIAALMDVAASGGYYIACACDEIHAQNSTITGSIGVIMQMVDVSGTMQMIGVRSDAITSGAMKDAGSPLREMKPEEREIFQSIVNQMYDRFVKVVADGRSALDEEAVRTIADGRIYVAPQALDLGLIDRVATLRETIGRAKQLAGVEAAKVIAYHRPYDYKPNVYATVPPAPPDARSLFSSEALTLPSAEFLYIWKPGAF